jgi:hypothetical protein
LSNNDSFEVQILNHSYATRVLENRKLRTKAGVGVFQQNRPNVGHSARQMSVLKAAVVHPAYHDANWDIPGIRGLNSQWQILSDPDVPRSPGRHPRRAEAEPATDCQLLDGEPLLAGQMADIVRILAFRAQ